MSRLFFLLAGHFFVGLAIAGAFLPLLPSTPFALLASACYMRSSERLRQRLLSHSVLGPPLRNWHETRSISTRAKALAVASIVCTMGVSIFVAPLPSVRWLLVGIGACVTLFIVTRPSPPA